MDKDESVVEETPQVEAPQEEAPVITQDEPQEIDGNVEAVETSEEAPEAAEAGSEEPTAEPSRRENKRIQQLLQKMKQQEQSQAPYQEPDQSLDYRQKLDADDEVVKLLEEDRRRHGEQSYSQGVQQANSILFNTRLEIDAPKVEQKYSQLDQKSPDFNPSLANAINEWYLTTVGYDPRTKMVRNADIRYSEFVEGIMELGENIAGEKVQASRKNIVKQAVNTGLRPDGSQAKSLNLNKAPQDMTDEELEAVIKANLK